MAMSAGKHILDRGHSGKDAGGLKCSQQAQLGDFAERHALEELAVKSDPAGIWCKKVGDEIE